MASGRQDFRWPAKIGASAAFCLVGALAGTGLYFGNLAYIGPKPQSISFTNPPVYGPVGGSATLSATGGGSGNPVIFSVDPASGTGVCTLSGSTVTLHKPGSCVIDANQAGNATYAAAPQAQLTITAGGKPQSISLTAPSYGTVGGAATLLAVGGGSGNPVVLSVDASSAGVCTLSGSASGSTVTYAAAGSCVIDASQAGNATYAAAQAQQTIAVTLKPQSISFDAPSSGTVGGSASVSATASSGLAVTLMVDSASAGVCTLSGNMVTYAAAGSCVIDANQPGNATYAAAQAQQTITVSQPS
jgi:hypothetical protein